MKNLLKTLYHDSTKNYVSNPYPKLKEEIEIKIRIKKSDKIKAIYIRYRNLGEEVIKKMEIAYEKNGLIYYKVNVTCHEKLFSYYFNIATEDEIYYYNQAKITKYRPDNSKNFKILVDYDAPDWMASTAFYQIMADRFHNAKPEITIKPGAYKYQGFEPINMKWDEKPYEWDKAHCMDFYGGDLYGVKEKLDYLQELGVNAIYFNPIFTSPTIHKYDALDYFEIDPSLGGDEAFSELCKEIHDRGMRVILDISINHTSSSSKWFNKEAIFYDKSIGAYHNPDSPYREFYFINEDGEYKSWAGVKTMPQLNYGSEKLRRIIYKDDDSVLKKYLKAPYNIDGWRFDVADVMARNDELNVYDEVWEEIYKEIKSVNPKALILAEEWQDAAEMYDGKKWDSTMNYFSSNIPIREFAGEGDLFTNRHPELSKIKYKFGAKKLAKKINQFYNKVPSQIQYQMFNLINSHDVTRLYNNPEIDHNIYKGAVMTIFGLPGATNIYYGDEKHLDGEMHSVEGARYPMDWSIDLPEEKNEIFEMYKKLARLKAEDEAYGFGGFKALHAKKKVFAFARFTEDIAYITIWNKNKEEIDFNIDLEIFGLENAEILMGEANFSKVDKKLKITTQPMQSAVIKLV